MSVCSGCAAPIKWVITEAGKRMPLDPEPNAAGNLVVTGCIQATGMPIVRALPVGGLFDPTDMTGPRFVSHFATCPQAGEFRRKGKQ